MTKTLHISFGLGTLEAMADADLEASFTNDGKAIPAAEVREYIQSLREKGFVYLPCSCNEQNADGSCKGWSKEPTDA